MSVSLASGVEKAALALRLIMAFVKRSVRSLKTKRKRWLKAKNGSCLLNARCKCNKDL